MFKKGIIFTFAAANLLLISMVASFRLLPLANELSGLLSLRRVQEARLRIKQQNLKQYEENLMRLYEMEQDINRLRTVPYSEIANTLAEINRLAVENGLAENDFHTNQPVANEVFHHVKVNMMVGGTYQSLCEYAEALSRLPLHIDQITLIPDSAEAVLCLSIYATDG